MNQTHDIRLQNQTQKLVLTAMFLAIGIILPFCFGQIPQIGSMLLPMHIPVFLCTFICGWRYGVPMAIILPLLRSILFTKPNLYPEAISIAFEMATYAFVAGYLYSRSKWKCTKALYRCMLTAMVGGRIVRIIAQFLLLGINGKSFALASIFMGIVVAGIPGIVLQLFVIPAIMLMLNRTSLVLFSYEKTDEYQKT